MIDDEADLGQAFAAWLEARDAPGWSRVVQCAYERLRRLARKMRQGRFGGERPCDTDDVLHEGLVRLAGSLEDARVLERYGRGTSDDNLRHFFGLAALKFRQVLGDLWRKHRLRRASSLPSGSGVLEAPSPSPEGIDWGAFHEAVAAMPDEEREVCELLWYHELPQKEAAALLGVTVRTVQNRWVRARSRLGHLFEDGR